MKLSLSDLKKAIQWIEANSNDMQIKVNTFDPGKLFLDCEDRQGRHVCITLYDDASMMAKITKSDTL